MMLVWSLSLLPVLFACGFPALPDETDGAELDAAVDAVPDAQDGPQPDAPIDAAIDASPDAAVVPPGMVTVAPGPFMRGCNVTAECTTAQDALPFVEVTLSRFAIDRTEVSRAEYAACLSAGGCTSQPRDGVQAASVLPVQVAYAGAVEFCTWKGRRLPTEAEWEKAARSLDGRHYPWGSTSPTCLQARHAACTPQTVDPVDSHPAGASPYGVLNMSGNEWEWVADWYAATYYQTGPTTDPTGPIVGIERVVRGGTFTDSPASGPALMTWARRRFDPSINAVGFRCAVGLP